MQAEAGRVELLIISASARCASRLGYQPGQFGMLKCAFSDPTEAVLSKALTGLTAARESKKRFPHLWKSLWKNPRIYKSKSFKILYL